MLDFAQASGLLLVINVLDDVVQEPATMDLRQTSSQEKWLIQRLVSLCIARARGPAVPGSKGRKRSGLWLSG